MGAPSVHECCERSLRPPVSKRETLLSGLSSLRSRLSASTQVQQARDKQSAPDDEEQPWSEAKDGGSSMQLGHFLRKASFFADTEAMKEKVRQNLAVDKKINHDGYKDTGFWQYLARHIWFERTMLFVILVNAIWIAYDTDHNTAEVLTMAHPVFQVAENIFCVVFSFEWVIRFCSFRKKVYALRDGWFVFDSLLVSMMVLETWVMTAVLLLTEDGGGGNGLGNSSVLKMARLMRLSRMARVARLLKAMPELMIMVKGMITSIRSVAITLTLLILLMYSFGIAFTQLTRKTEVGDKYFTDVLTSMYILAMHGTLCDNIKLMSDQLGQEHPFLAAFFFLYVLLTAFTVMNMLIGVLCEIVSAVAATEREEIKVSYVKGKVLEVVEEIDQDGDRQISKSELVSILESVSACRALKEVGVDVVSLVDNADALFVDVHGRVLDHLSFADFMHVVLSLRGTNTATVKDIVELRRSLHSVSEDITMRIEPLTRKVQQLVADRKGSQGLQVAEQLEIVQHLVAERKGVQGPQVAEHLELEGSWCPLAKQQQACCRCQAQLACCCSQETLEGTGSVEPPEVVPEVSPGKWAPHTDGGLSVQLVGRAVVHPLAVDYQLEQQDVPCGAPEPRGRHRSRDFGEMQGHVSELRAALDAALTKLSALEERLLHMPLASPMVTPMFSSAKELY